MGLDYDAIAAIAGLQRQRSEQQQLIQQDALHSPAALAAAALDAQRTALLPKQTAADIAKSTAETGLIGQQAKFLGPEALARIGGLNADAGLARANTIGVRNLRVSPFSTDQASIDEVLGQRSTNQDYNNLKLGNSSTYGGYSLKALQDLSNNRTRPVY